MAQLNRQQSSPSNQVMRHCLHPGNQIVLANKGVVFLLTQLLLLDPTTWCQVAPLEHAFI